MKAIFLREVHSFATTMLGWAFSAFVLLFMGVYVMVYNLNYGYGNFEYALSGLTFVYLMAVPILTMRCFAEERRSGTDLLLYSLPITSGKVVAGKYLAMLALLAVPTLISCTYPIILSIFGEVYFPTAYAAIAAFFLLGAGLTAIGMFASSLCESQVTAAVVCFVILLADYFLPGIASFIPSGAAPAIVAITALIALAAVAIALLTRNGVFALGAAIVAEAALVVTAVADASALDGIVTDALEGLSLFDRFSPFVNGIVDVSALVFFVAVGAAFFVLTVHSFERRRWA